MVFPGERDYMATTTTTRPERSKTLHNFTLPNLKWGSQRHLKCMKIDSMSNNGVGGGYGDHRLRRRSPPLKYDGSSTSIPFRFREANHRSNSNNQHHRLRNASFKSVEDGCGEEGIKELGVKLISDLKTERDKITQSMFKKDVIEEEQDDGSGSGSGSGSGQEKEKEMEISPAKPWNLRKRRAACKEPISKIEHNNGRFEIEEKIVNPSPPSILKGRGGVAEIETKERRTKLYVMLPKKEIEEDFMAILGRRPPRRPKKRPRTVQRKLDNIFPGLYLSEVTLDAYKVPEEAKNQQR